MSVFSHLTTQRGDANGPYDDVPPREYLFDPRKAAFEDMKALFELFKRDPTERDVDRFLREHREVLGTASCLFRAGHHGVWIIPQAKIKLPSLDGDSGLVPDYLIAARSSDGIAWWILELKRPSDQMFKLRRDGSAEPTSPYLRAKDQLFKYLEYCETHQEFIRQQLGIRSFRRPYGVLVMGRERELKQHAAKMNAKRRENAESPRYQVRTWDALLREIRNVAVIGDLWKHWQSIEMKFRLDFELTDDALDQ